MAPITVGDEVRSLKDDVDLYVIAASDDTVTVSDGVANEWSYPRSAFVHPDADIDPDGIMWTFRLIGYVQRDDIGVTEITCPECTRDRLNDGATDTEPAYRNEIAQEGEMCLLCFRSFDDITTETEIQK